MRSPGWYLNRLRAMSAREVAHRAGRLAHSRLHALTVGFAPGRVPEPTDVFTGSYLDVPAGADPARYLAAAARILEGDSELLFKTVSTGLPPAWNRNPVSGEVVPMRYGKTIDYRDRNLVGDIKYVWVLNRHHQTLRLAQAYALSGDRTYLNGVRELVDSWIRDCVYPYGPNWTSALEAAIRLINWSAAFHLCGGLRSPLFDGPSGVAFKHSWLTSVYRHMAFIHGHFSRHSSANNHLLGEAAGLFVATTTWPYWPRCSAWNRNARRILEEQAALQVSEDGVDREQSTFYQNFVLEFLQVAGVAGRIAGNDFSPDFWQRLEHMYEFCAALLDVGGRMPAIGDSDDALVLPLDPTRSPEVHHASLCAGARLFQRDELARKVPCHARADSWLSDRAARPAGDRPQDRGLPTAFPAGGYYILGDRLGQPDEVRMTVNAGPLGYLSIAAHGHADALSLTLSVAGEPILVDPGTYAYQSEPAWRDYFRGTSAHNTVRVDGQDQAVIGGTFMWLTRYATTCTCWTTSEEADRLTAFHDGYARLPDSVIHTRHFDYDKRRRAVTIVDRLEGRSHHDVERFWHFAPHLTVEIVGRTVRVHGRRASLDMVIDDADELTLHRGDEQPKLGWTSPKFGELQPTTTLRCRSRVADAPQLTTTIRLAPMAAAGGREQEVRANDL